MPVADDGLNDRQRKFVELYAVVGNAAEAYRRAGYRPSGSNSARSNAARLLTNDSIQRALARLRREAGERAKVEAAEVMRRLWQEADRRDGGTTSAGRVAALRTLAQCLGLLKAGGVPREPPTASVPYKVVARIDLERV